MAGLHISTKRIQIDKANQSVLIILSVAAFLTIFSIFMCKAMLTKRSSQSKVIAGQTAALKQLEANVKAVEALNSSYKDFVGNSTNLISGNSGGNGDRDGDNARIILDALPSKYDFPALTASLEKILSRYKIQGIGGSDDEVNQSTTASSEAKGPVPMPFTISVAGDPNGMHDMLSTLEKSIRPIQVNTLSISGGDAGLTVEIMATTYYQPETKLSITTKEIR